MKRLTIAIALLLIAVPCFAGGFSGKASNEIADITYLLRCWPTGVSVVDQTYTNGQVIDTIAEGCLDGSLTVVGTNYTSVSNKLNIPDESTEYACSGVMTRSIGLASIFNFITGTSVEYGSIYGPYFGFKSAASVNYSNSIQLVGVENVSSTPKLYGLNASTETVTPNTTYPIALVLGGYDSNGVPYKSGDTKANFTYGYSTFRKLTGVWNLVNKSGSGTANPYFCANGYSSDFYYISNLLIPSYDFSAVLQPTHLSTFGTDGELSTYTPDVGSAWTETSGDWDTSSGKVVNTTAGIATFDPSLTTGMYDVTITMPASGTTAGGLVARYADATHYWYVALAIGSSNNVVLYENDGGSVVARSTASATLSASTAYAVRLIVSSTSPYWTTYVAGASKNSYSTVGSSSTATKFGLYDGGDLNMTGFDVVGFWPLTSATYTSEFAKVGY